MCNKSSNSKRFRTLIGDSIIRKNMDMGLKNATYDKIVRVRTLRVPSFMLIKPIGIICKQQKISVRFLQEGILMHRNDHSKLIGFLLNSVKYN